MGRKNRQRTFTQSRYAARAGIWQTFTQSRYDCHTGLESGQKEPQHEYKEHTIVTHVHPEQVRCPKRCTANSRNTKNIRGTLPAQQEYKEHKIVTQDWKLAERTTGRGRSPRAQDWKSITQSRYAARAGICQQQEYKEHKIVTQDWKWAERTTGRGRSPRAGTLPAPASANSTNTKNIRLSHRTGNGQKEPRA